MVVVVVVVTVAAATTATTAVIIFIIDILISFHCTVMISELLVQIGTFFPVKIHILSIFVFFWF